jgi:hypothetical protein
MASGNILVTGDTNVVTIHDNTYAYLQLWVTETCTGNKVYDGWLQCNRAGTDICVYANVVKPINVNSVTYNGFTITSAGSANTSAPVASTYFQIYSTQTGLDWDIVWHSSVLDSCTKNIKLKCIVDTTEPHTVTITYDTDEMILALYAPSNTSEHPDNDGYFIIRNNYEIKTINNELDLTFKYITIGNTTVSIDGTQMTQSDISGLTESNYLPYNSSIYMVPDVNDTIDDSRFKSITIKKEISSSIEFSPEYYSTLEFTLSFWQVSIPQTESGRLLVYASSSLPNDWETAVGNQVWDWTFSGASTYTDRFKIFNKSYRYFVFYLYELSPSLTNSAAYGAVTTTISGGQIRGSIKYSSPVHTTRAYLQVTSQLKAGTTNHITIRFYTTG